MDDERNAGVSAWIHAIIADLPPSLSSTLARTLCSILLRLPSQDNRSALEKVIEQGGEREVLRAISVGGMVAPKYAALFGKAIKSICRTVEGCQWLYFSDYYPSVVQFALSENRERTYSEREGDDMSEQPFLNVWVEYLILARRREEAWELVVQSGWGGGSLEEFVVKVLRRGASANDLLCYLL